MKVSFGLGMNPPGMSHHPVSPTAKPRHWFLMQDGSWAASRRAPIDLLVEIVVVSPSSQLLHAHLPIP